MNPTRRLAPFLLPLFFAPLLISQPGRAQTSNSDARYAFADTTLLRDTLGLSFPRLFPIADSLHETPDTLRALSIRYRWSIGRLVVMADSLGVPVDSVGPIMTRERFNPLANQANSNTMNYQSLYNIAQQQSTWTNNLTLALTRGGFQINNNTNISTQRTQTGGLTNVNTTTASTTNLNWRIQRDLWAGMNASLQGSSNNTPGSINNYANSNNTYGLTINSQQRPARGLTTKLNLVGGVVDAHQIDQFKRGLSGSLTGEARYSPGAWLTHDLNGSVSGNLARLGVPFLDDGIPGPDAVQTHDLNTDLRGVLGLWQNAPVGFNLNYRLSKTSVATAGSVVLDTLAVPPPGQQYIEVQQVNNLNNSVDGALRLRQDNGRQLNITGNLGATTNATAGATSSLKTLDNAGFGANGNYEIGNWVLQGQFGMAHTISAFPRFAPTGGYRENQEANSLNGQATWSATQNFNVQFLASIGLTSFTYETIGSYPTTPVPHDQYNQSYSITPNLRITNNISTNVKLEVQRSQFINIPAASTASNTETHSYRATWQWSMLTLGGLTIGQINAIGATYTFFPFVPSSNRLALSYTTTTTLAAVLTPRLNLTVTHFLQSQPSGNYLPQSEADPIEVFSKADEDRSRRLDVTLSYTPIPAFSLRLAPSYLLIERYSTTNGVLGLERSSPSLTLTGGATLNIPVAPGCTLQGNLNRNYRGNRSTTYGLSGADQTPLSVSDFWSGDLTLTWTP